MSTNANPPRGSMGPAPKAKQPTVPEGLGVFGSLRQPDDIYLFGTDGEIRNRNATGYNVSGTPPENRPPSFKQIRPAPTSKDLNKPTAVSYKGDQKYGGHRKYA
jgi:hypothetical protein